MKEMGEMAQLTSGQRDRRQVVGMIKRHIGSRFTVYS